MARFQINSASLDDIDITVQGISVKVSSVHSSFGVSFSIESRARRSSGSVGVVWIDDAF